MRAFLGFLLLGALLLCSFCCVGSLMLNGEPGPRPTTPTTSQANRPAQPAQDDKSEPEDAPVVAQPEPPPSTEQPEPKKREDDYKWIERGRDAVRGVLKHPHNAHFWFLDNDVAWQRNDKICVVRGKVDAINDFGAKLTKDYRVEFVVDDTSYTVVHLVLGGELYIDRSKSSTFQEMVRREQEPAPDRPRTVPDPEFFLKEAREEANRWRTWTSGKFTVRAKFKSKAGDTVKLEREDGTVIEVPDSKLSDADNEWINSQGWKD